MRRGGSQDEQMILKPSSSMRGRDSSYVSSAPHRPSNCNITALAWKTVKLKVVPDDGTDLPCRPLQIYLGPRLSDAAFAHSTYQHIHAHKHQQNQGIPPKYFWEAA